MFKAQIDWRGITNYSRLAVKDEDSIYKLVDDEKNVSHHISGIIFIISFVPLTEKYEADLGTEVKKSILGKKVETQTTIEADKITNKTRLHVLAPYSAGYGQCSDSELRQLVVDVPFEAIKHLSVIAERTKSIIDLTPEGQSKIAQAFHDKTGIFANPEEQHIMLDIDQPAPMPVAQSLPAKPYIA
jgi:hypothetical protein